MYIIFFKRVIIAHNIEQYFLFFLIYFIISFSFRTFLSTYT